MIFSEHFLSVEIFFLSGNGPSDVYSYPTVLIMQGQNGKDNQKQPFKVAPYSFRSVSLKFCPRARLVVLHATRVVDVACVAGFLKLRFQRIYLLRQNIVIYTRGPSWDCRLVARGN